LAGSYYKISINSYMFHSHELIKALKGILYPNYSYELKKKLDFLDKF